MWLAFLELGPDQVLKLKPGRGRRFHFAILLSEVSWRALAEVDCAGPVVIGPNQVGPIGRLLCSELHLVEI